MIDESQLEKVEFLPSKDKRLGRHIVHDTRSRGFAMRTTVDLTTWVTKRIRIYDPIPNPNQCHGECTCVAQCVMFNAVGNRKRGVVLKMDDAHKLYSLATTLDPFPGSWTAPSWTDTGSSGLAAAQASQQLGLGGAYNFIFGGADEIVQAVQNGHVVSVGTKWYDNMFYPDAQNRITPGGSLAGGHQYSARGYLVDTDDVIIRCWWGTEFRDVKIKRPALHDLVMDDGDAHVQVRA